MTRDIINVQYPTLDHTESVANICIEKTDVAAANGVTIAEAFSNPNSMLGDIVIELPAGVSAIQLQDLSRFEKADGSIDLDFAEGFSGTIFAVAKWAGVRPVEA